MNIDVEFYELPDGSEPAREFLDGLDRKMRAKMYREIDLLVMNGPELREPHSKCLNDGIFELRAKQGSDISRIENGTRNPSLEMVKRLARGMGMVLKLEFVPEPKAYK